MPDRTSPGRTRPGTPVPSPPEFEKRGARRDRGRREMEARLLRAVQGPGVVPLRSVRRTAHEVTIELDAAHSSLADVLAERGPLSDTETRAVAMAATAALARVHEAGIVHGDVKPANVLLGGHQELWLADFDAAAAVDSVPSTWATPCRQRRDAAAGPVVDGVALAVMLVELSTGVIVDPGSRWSAAALEELGCPRSLAADLSPVLDSDQPPSVRAIGAAVDDGDNHALPVPAEHARFVDPTPTVECLPAIGPVPTVPKSPNGKPVIATSVAVTLLALTALIVLAGLLL